MATNTNTRTPEQVRVEIEQEREQLATAVEQLRDELAEDPEFLRKLKPSLIKARANGELPTDEPAGGTRHAPSAPQLTQRPKPPKPKRKGGVSPWLVIAGALAAGYVLAKAIDWRGHAHPRV